MRENTIKKSLHIRCFNERAVQVAGGRQQSFAVTAENGKLGAWGEINGGDEVLAYDCTIFPELVMPIDTQAVVTFVSVARTDGYQETGNIIAVNEDGDVFESGSGNVQIKYI